MTLESLCELMEIDTRPVGIYDAPDPAQFTPLIELKRCVFDHYADWQEGKTLDITTDTGGCPGCGYWITGTERFRSREAFVSFLAHKEGLRESPELMKAWLDDNQPYCPANGHVLIGPVRTSMVRFLKTVTFFVKPDQLSILLHGAVYHAHPDDLPPVIAPFGSGCGQMLPMFSSLEKAQAAIGSTDIAMRNLLPPDRLAFTVTVPMLDRLLSLDPEQSFLGKPFLKKLKAARNS